MAKLPLCINPVSIKDKIDDPGFNVFADYNRLESVNQVKPYIIDFEANSKCLAGCAFCYASSDSATDYLIPKEKVMEVLDDAWELGVRLIQWGGGDPLLHPDWFANMSYAAEKGMQNSIATTGLVSKNQAKKISELKDSLRMVAVHISTINPEVYQKLHHDPKNLDARIQGYRNLIEAGIAPDEITAIVTATKPALEVFEETCDWYVDEMGCRSFCFAAHKPCGFGKEHLDWEPSLSNMRRAIEYRAKKLGKHWLRIGSSDGSLFYCRTNIALLYDGSVVPCTMIRELMAGNIYQERLTQILDNEKNRNDILFNYEIKGVCGSGECENSDICFGCRATAYQYLGDVGESDPKCFMNPDAKETYFS